MIIIYKKARINNILKVFLLVFFMLSVAHAKDLHLSKEKINLYLSKMNKDKYCEDFNKLPFTLQTNKEFLSSYLKKFLYFKAGFCFNKKLLSDKESAKLLVVHGSNYIKALSKDLQNDPDIAFLAVSILGNTYKILTPKMKAQKQILLKALEHMHRWDIESIIKNDIPKKLLDDKQIALKLVNKNVNSLKYLSKRLQKDVDVAIVALKKDPHTIAHIDKTLLSNEKVIEVYLSQPNVSLSKLDPSVMQNKKFMSIFVKASSQNYCNLPNYLKSDKKLALEALKKDFSIVKCFDKSFLNDRDFVLQMVSKNGLTLQYVNAKFRDDKEILSKAIEQNALSYLYASKNLKNDKLLTIKAVTGLGILLNNLSMTQKADKDIVLSAVKSNPLALKFASSNLKNDKEVVLQAVKESHLALFFASHKLKRDRAFALKVLKVNGLALVFFFHDLIEDKQLIKEAIKQNKNASCYANVFARKLALATNECELKITEYMKIVPYSDEPNDIETYLSYDFDRAPEIDVKIADIDNDGKKDQITLLYQRTDMRSASVFIDIMATKGRDISFENAEVYTGYYTEIDSDGCLKITNADWGNWAEGSTEKYCYRDDQKSWYLKFDTSYAPHFDEKEHIAFGKFDDYGSKYKMNHRIDGEWLIDFKKVPLQVFLQNVKTKNYDELDAQYIDAYLKKFPLSKNNVWIYNNIAFYLSKQANSDISVYLLEKIIKIFPKRAVSYLNLADILNDYNKEKASAYYAIYVKLMKEKHKESKIVKRAIKNSI